MESVYNYCRGAASQSLLSRARRKNQHRRTQVTPGIVPRNSRSHSALLRIAFPLGSWNAQLTPSDEFPGRGHSLAGEVIFVFMWCCLGSTIPECNAQYEESLSW